MRILCYTFTGKKLQDFIPYFFEDTMNNDTEFYHLVDYVKINTEQNIQSDFSIKNRDDYFDEIYVILNDKIRLNSFSKPLNQYTYCSFETLCTSLCKTSLGNLDVDTEIDYYMESSI